ncbi:MAG: PAS domain-containing protein, partial [Candidatus Marinimicrobia bacterium]|nr:PAS domain-containing protein [Candidatus Neomarinimicrobiota bacterium]
MQKANEVKFKNIKMKSDSEKLISPVQTKIPTLKYYKIFKNIFHKSPWPICLLNTDGDILDMNSSCEKLLEIDKEKFIGRSNILKDKFLLIQDIELLFKEVITSKSSKEFSFYYYKYRGKTFANDNQDIINDKNNKIYISGVIHPLLDNHGNVQYFFGEFADKTKEVNLHKINALGGSFGNDYNLNIENTYKTIQEIIPGICLLYSTGTHRSGSGIHWYNNIQSNTDSQDILNFWYQYIKENPLIFISG